MTVSWLNVAPEVLETMPVACVVIKCYGRRQHDDSV